jgi:flavin reductase (DIM6/NTAB) family NADH-FMN oxidoreductase RutF
MPFQSAEMDFDPLAYRRALGGFGTGVALVAARDSEGRSHGLIVNSLTSVSLHPPIVLWCLGNSCAAFDVFTHATEFTINILGAGEEDLARQFSKRGDRIITDDQIIHLKTGAPALGAAVANLDCRMRSRQPMGDHEVIFGDVAAFRMSPEASALGYFRGRYVTLTVGED